MQSGLQESKTEAWEELLFSPLSWLQRTDKFGFLLLLLLFFVVLFNLFFVGPEPFFLLRTFVLMVYFFVAMTLTLQQLVDLRCGQDEGYELSTGTKTSSTTTVFYHKIFRCEFLYIHIIVSNFKGLKMWSLSECSIQGVHDRRPCSPLRSTKACLVVEYCKTSLPNML